MCQINSIQFQTYVGQVLVPTLSQGNVVVMDAWEPQGRACAKAIDEAGATLL